MKKALPRYDSANVGGLTELMNKQSVSPKINLLEAENRIIGKINDKNETTKDQRKMLESLSKDLGLDSDNEKEDGKADDKASIYSSSSKASKSSKSSVSSARSKKYEESKPAVDFKSTIAKLEFNEMEDTFVINNVAATKTADPRYKETNEIDNVLGEMSGSRNHYSDASEKIRDIKNSKLEQIEELKKILKEEGITCEDYSGLTVECSIGEIDAVLNSLKHKNSRQRYSDIANEVLMSGAEALESVFDGTRSIPFLGIKPDYRGYHNTLHSKLQRMRFNTSEIVGKALESVEASDLLRIVVEILPGLITYPTVNKRQMGQKTLSSDPAFGDIRDSLISIQNKKNLSELNNI